MNRFISRFGPHVEREEGWYKEERACEFLSRQSESSEPGEWEAVTEAVSKLAGRYAQLQGLVARVDSLERKLSEVPRSSSIIVPISTFDPEPFDLLKEIKVVVQPSDDEFVATFFDANVNASGCNETNAVDMLKKMLLARFDYLDKQPITRLGPAIVRQIAVLRTFIRRRT